eukprot:291161-Chlamydomonas_euryale.AAC.1
MRPHPAVQHARDAVDQTRGMRWSVRGRAGPRGSAKAGFVRLPVRTLARPLVRKGRCLSARSLAEHCMDE